MRELPPVPVTSALEANLESLDPALDTKKATVIEKINAEISLVQNGELTESATMFFDELHNYKQKAEAAQTIDEIQTISRDISILLGHDAAPTPQETTSSFTRADKLNLLKQQERFSERKLKFKALFDSIKTNFTGFDQKIEVALESAIQGGIKKMEAVLPLEPLHAQSNLTDEEWRAAKKTFLSNKKSFERQLSDIYLRSINFVAQAIPPTIPGRPDFSVLDITKEKDFATRTLKVLPTLIAQYNELKDAVVPTEQMISELELIEAEVNTLNIPVPEADTVEPPQSVEQMKSNLNALDEQVNALYDTRTIPLYNLLKAQGLTEHPAVKKLYGKDGTFGSLISAFSICALAKARFVEELNKSSSAEPSPLLVMLYQKFSKQVAVLQQKVEMQIKGILPLLFPEPAAADVISAGIAEQTATEQVNDITSTPVTAGVTESEQSHKIDVSPTATEASAPLPALILNEQIRAKDDVPESPQPQKLAMESAPAAEQVEIDADVHKMESTITTFEQEIQQFAGQYTWIPEHEVNSVKAMIDQFDRMLADYYEEPTPGLLEKLKNTFSIIETLHREVKEGHIDVFAILGDVDTFQRDLARLERAPSNNPFERTVLRSLIENFRGLYARFVRAEEGEEKIMLGRQLVKMYNNVKQAHLDAEASVIRPPEVKEIVEEVATLKKIVDELFEKPNLPPQTVQLLGFAKTEMLTRLGLLSPTDTEYIQLRDKINEVISAAQQLGGEEVTITPSPKVEEAANENIAPRWPETEKKLRYNRKFVAALLLAAVSVIHSDRLSEQSVNVQIASAGPLSDIGLDAKWGNGERSTVLVPVRRAPDEEIRVVRPNTGEDVPEESKAAAETNVEVTPEVTVVRADTADVIVSPSGSADTNMYVMGSAEEADPKSPAYQESIAPTESVASGNNVVEVLRGNEATYPDRAINPILAAVDATGIPEVLANKLRAEEKEAFLSDANRLKAAGVRSGQRSSTFPGEKINYSDPVERLKQRFNEYRQYLNVPHTEVAEAGDTRTSLTLESYARDLNLIPKEDQLNLASAAVEAYYATPGGRETLNGEDKDTLKPGAVVPLQGVAPFLAAEIANYVRKTVAAGNAESAISNAVETEDVSGSASEVIEDKGEPGEVTSPEEYPGGVMAFSQAYNQLLESFGIAIKAPAMFDSWFTVDRAEYNNRELLGMTVGEITNIMMQGPADVMRELNARKISPEAADAVYQLVIEARKNGLAPYATDSTITLEEVIKRNVLAQASTNK